jgi:hypothetical protein
MLLDDNLSFRCSSAGRVTAGLLLSFLALSTPVTARQNNGAQMHLGGEELPAIPPSFPSPGGDEPQGGAAERFVSHSLRLMPIIESRRLIVFVYLVTPASISSWREQIPNLTQT